MFNPFPLITNLLNKELLLWSFPVEEKEIFLLSLFSTLSQYLNSYVIKSINYFLYDSDL